MTMVCPVCKRGNGAWIGCHNAACTDGRNLIPVSPAVADLAAARAEIERLKADNDEMLAASTIMNAQAEDLSSRLYRAEAEIERLTKERDEATSTVELVNSNNLTLAAELAGWKQVARQMEAERDEALAQVALAWIAVGAGKGGCGLPCGYDCNGACFAPPTDAQSALEAYGREKVREGMRRAADVALRYDTGEGAYDAILAEMEKEGGE